MIPVAEPYFSGNELKYVEDCIKSGWVSSAGSYIKQFESEFAKFCSAKYAVAVSNCTAALHLALRALNIKENDEVLVPNLTFAATANTPIYLGAKPVLVECDRETWNIDVQKIEEKITEKTKAIIPVHLYGHPCDMGAIMEIAKKHNLYVIEDAAEAHGAEYKGAKIGSIGDIGCFSFYGNKIITTGEGGMCVTNSHELNNRMRILRDHGMSPEKKYWHNEVGFNYRMTNIQAALGLAQLEQIEGFIKKKRENAILYNSLLKNIPGIILPPEKEWAKNVYWMYIILLGENFPATRDELMKKLLEKEIETRPFFYPLSEMPPYKTEEKFEISSEISSRGINLPSSVKLTRENIEYIAEAIKSV